MPPAKIAEATIEHNTILLLVMGRPPVAITTGGDKGLARENVLQRRRRRSVGAIGEHRGKREDLRCRQGAACWLS
jgi:hypothetical protein